MRVVAVMWDSLSALMAPAAREAGVDVVSYPIRALDGSDGLREEMFSAAMGADLVLLYRTTNPFWGEEEERLEAVARERKVICVGQNPMYWTLSNVDPAVVSGTYGYLRNGTLGNFVRMLRYLAHSMGFSDAEPEPPVVIPWQGLVSLDDPERVFGTLEDYLTEHPPPNDGPNVGVIVSRGAWISGQRSIEEEIAAALEAEGMNPILLMTNSLHDPEVGSMNISECVERHFVRNGEPVVSAILKLVTFMSGKIPGDTDGASASNSTPLYAGLNVPVFQPIVSFAMSRDEWLESDGISSDVSWAVALPEFEGAVEPVMLGTTMGTGAEYDRSPVPGRAGRIAARIGNWVSMAAKPPGERRIAIVLNNNPCESSEANVGSASGLDALESVARLLADLRGNGYSVDVPESGKALAETFLERKALSEFRWTTKEEIISHGGVAYKMPAREYSKFFESIPEKARSGMLETWGEPPGEGMVADGHILIPGLPMGNAFVAVQPKRGCFGARCDGSVCRILHDPTCPPTHQYVAFYHYIRHVFKADAIIHVGTHGTMEFLPGKGIGLSGDCFPDVCVGDTPFVYVYNTDNPAEATTAKRRAYAITLGHLQAPAAVSGLYGPLEKLDSLLAEYATASTDPSREHALQHMILDAAGEAGIEDPAIGHGAPMDALVRKCHEILTQIRTTMRGSGLHVLGDAPTGDGLVDTVASVARFDPGNDPDACRRVVGRSMGVDYETALNDPSGFDADTGMSHGAILEKVDRNLNAMVRDVLSGTDVNNSAKNLGLSPDGAFAQIAAKVSDIASRIVSSDELGSLRNRLSAGFTEPGPSGYMDRGRDDVLPTGRNMYSLDPKRIPTTSSWRVGTRLAEALLDKYVADEGRLPESVAFQWMTSDITGSDGEMMAEILCLLGAEPVWSNDGRVVSVRLVPLKELGRPRIDVTMRISGILRDNFSNCVDLVDAAVELAATADEPPERNYVRKHYLEDVSEGVRHREATARIFSMKPCAYSSGVNLAILSGAWKDNEDLARIYIAGNGYAYGGGRNGEGAHAQFASGLKKVELTFNKVVSDEHDLLGCCCYYANQGGLTSAARHLSGKDVKTYYGDTREPSAVGVRTLAEEIRRVSRAKLLNPEWIEGMKAHGYSGATHIMKRVSRIYGWEASTGEVEDSIFNDVAETFVIDPEMRGFFRDNNPYALEEIARRLLEAERRGLWDADPEVLERLRKTYLEIESWMEGLAGDGEFQGGSIDIYGPSDIDGWGDNINEIMEAVRRRLGR
ncbi:MAG: cobaltochelatase subunit CobN [Thermoplasmatales archaeon]|nr:cobaltochelatase subunit CobN [Thermoplasmatales archaeon]